MQFAISSLADIEWNIADHVVTTRIFWIFKFRASRTVQLYKVQLIAHKCHAHEQKLDIEIVCFCL